MTRNPKKQIIELSKLMGGDLRGLVPHLMEVPVSKDKMSSSGGVSV